MSSVYPALLPPSGGPDLYLTLRPVHLFLLYKYASAGEVFTSTLTRTFLRSYSNVLSSTEQPYFVFL